MLFRSQLDFVVLVPVSPFGVPLTAKLSAENLLDDEFTDMQADRIARQYTTGVKMTVGLSYTY